MLTDFYSVMAQASFTLLGLWWLVLRSWPREWVDDPLRRRTGYHVSLYFMLPGLMSALSLLSTDTTFFWRAGFGIACVIGVAEAASFLRAARPPKWFAYVAIAFYALAAVLAARPRLIPDLTDGEMTALHVEGALLSSLLFLGLNLAWLNLIRRD